MECLSAWSNSKRSPACHHRIFTQSSFSELKIHQPMTGFTRTSLLNVIPIVSIAVYADIPYADVIIEICKVRQWPRKT